LEYALIGNASANEKAKMATNPRIVILNVLMSGKPPEREFFQ
jgi:hypothetical protein